MYKQPWSHGPGLMISPPKSCGLGWVGAAVLGTGDNFAASRNFPEEVV